jgi:hypothetical protein
MMPPSPQPGFAGPAPQAQGPSVGIVGISRGMPVFNFDFGDFAPSAILGAVVSGQGFKGARMMGLTMLALSIVVTIVNAILIVVLGRFYPYLFIIGAPLGWGGLWLAITGQPAWRPDGQAAPLWARGGLVVCLAIGLLMGLGMIALSVL